VREDLRDDYAAVAARFGHGDLLRMLSMVAELDTEGRFRKSANPRTMLEALLLRWAFLESTVDVETLLRAAGGEPRPFSGRAAEPPRRPRRATSTGGTPAARRSAARSLLRAVAAMARRRVPPPQRAHGLPRREVPPAAAGPAPARQSTRSGNPGRDAERRSPLMLDQARAPHGLGIFLKAARVAEAHR
jgi:hypothetical protein